MSVTLDDLNPSLNDNAVAAGFEIGDGVLAIGGCGRSKRLVRPFMGGGDRGLATRLPDGSTTSPTRTPRVDCDGERDEIAPRRFLQAGR